VAVTPQMFWNSSAGLASPAVTSSPAVAGAASKDAVEQRVRGGANTEKDADDGRDALRVRVDEVGLQIG
jgi:hypothetical protein